MEFKESIATCFGKYADFKGRATRSEYWWFWLFSALVTYAGFLIDETLGTLIQLGLLLPSIAVGVRRMHDMGNSGWFLLIPIYNIILLCTPSKYNGNKYW